MKQLLLLATLCLSLYGTTYAQKPAQNLIYVDKQGQIKWTKDKTNVYLFGVNYTLPFAYAYRAAKTQNLDLENAIDADVYHIARMGMDAFRVHIWDTEITDTTGNLLTNQHLRLFDYLVYRLKQRNIKIIITPIAFWGNGYPEKDEKTPGFSNKYGKDKATSNEEAIKAQEVYIKQLLQHTNPYTKLNYRDDPDIIAAELNNEPSHSGPKSGVTAYINRLAAAARSTGWTKPLFYNISQSPYYADAVAQAKVDGFSFQWYPIGLVAGHEQKGNFLPYINRYHIPYDTIAAFKNKAKIIYEFDAADILSPYMYPAVARSFKNAGFQWVTQFAYDPLSTAFNNTEYQTHYLNLAYTPNKAISMLIANRVFHNMPVNSNTSYPVDSIFKAFHVSYAQALSEMNTDQEFYYSNNTTAAPVNAAKLQHIAGVGSSAVVKYPGYGAYFIDKLANGIWRLEVMPDAISIRDPFERPSPQKEVTHIQWRQQAMQVKLSDLGANFAIKPLNQGNSFTATASNGSFVIKPGTYLLLKPGKSLEGLSFKNRSNIGLNEFEAPPSFNNEVYVRHTPVLEVSAGANFTISAKIINVDSADKVTLLVNKMNGPPITMIMERISAYDYQATLTAAQVTPGLLSYRIIVQKADNAYTVFPGGYHENPYNWQYYHNESWQTYVAAPAAKLVLFNATTDRERTNTYAPGYGRRGGAQFTAGEQTGELVFRASLQSVEKGQVMGMQLIIADKFKSRATELSSFNKIVVRARTTDDKPTTLRVALVQADGSARAVYVPLTKEYRNIELSLASFTPDSTLLLPRPYPDFQALWFKSGITSVLNLKQTDKLEITTGKLSEADFKKPLSIEIAAAWLEK